MKKFTLAFCLLSALAMAEPGQGGGPGKGGGPGQGQGEGKGPGGGGEGGGHRRPPKEAIDACQGRSANDKCSFAGRGGKNIEGTCFTPMADKPLACKPAHPPEGHGQH